LGFVFLSRNLGEDQPVYALQKQVAEDPAIFMTPEQYHDLAAEYVGELRKIQPHGPYHLTGFCQGGIIAFEMARQFHAAGEQVALLCMMDLWPEENTRRKWLFFPYFKIQRLLSIVRAQGASGLLTRLKGKLSGTVLQPLPSATTGEQATPSRSALALYWPGPDFRPPVFSGKITVFKVKRQEIYRTRDKTLGWGARALGGVDVEVIPGEHETFLREPHVKVVAEKIRERMPKSVAALAQR
jgi:thioesterase domain-containing protein